MVESMLTKNQSVLSVFLHFPFKTIMKLQPSRLVVGKVWDKNGFGMGLFVCLFVCLLVSLFVCLFVCLLVCLFVCLFVLVVCVALDFFAAIYQKWFASLL